MTEKWLLLVLQCCCTVAAISALNCSSSLDVMKLQISCFLEQNFELLPPEYFEKYTWPDQKRAYMELNLIEYSQLLCEHGKLETAIDCFMDVIKECRQDKKRIGGHVVKEVARVLEDVCGEKQKIRFQCVQRNIFDFLQCGAPRERGTTAPPAGGNMVDMKCRPDKERLFCQSDVLHACGCDTMRAYQLLLVEMFYPVDCPEIPDLPVKVCQGPAASMDRGDHVADQPAAPMLLSVVLITFQLFKF
ncbi:hypothetical protein BsWGS_24739 [Bradybaena similaris]